LKSLVAFIDDDKEATRQIVEYFSGDTKLSVRVFDSAYQASTCNAAAFVIDVSAVTDGFQYSSQAWAPIANLVERHPGARFIIRSFLNRITTEDIITEVKNVTGVEPCFFNAMAGFQSLRAFLLELLET
jgi:hypothetical protein